MIVYLRATDQKTLEVFLDFIEKVISKENTYLFFPTIIKALIEKLNMLNKNEIFNREKLAKSVKDRSFTYPGTDGDSITIKTLAIFTLMNELNREHFIKFLPMIIKKCKNLGVLNKSSFDQIFRGMIVQCNNLFIMPLVYQNILKKQFCKLNCVLGLNKEEQEYDNLLLLTNDTRRTYDNNVQRSIIKKRLDKADIKANPDEQLVEARKKKTIRKDSIDVKQIINLFSTVNCIGEDDWNEWFKSSSKILFEQSPSYPIYYCHYVIDYYFPLIKELYSYAFYSTIKYLNQESKSTIIDDIIEALNSSKTSSDILLTILNLTEYIERKNLGISFFDYNLFGKIAHKCKAFAKALYFKENYYIINKGTIEDLLELYYELKLPESAVGLLTYVNEESNIKNLPSSEEQKESEDNEYIYYIKLHNYEKSLDIINKKLKTENNPEKIKNLKKNKNICLNGLCDWEQLLIDAGKNTDKSNMKVFTIKDFKYNSDKMKDEIEKELLLSKACTNLGEWENLQIHFSKINSIFKQYYELENILIKDDENFEEGNNKDDNRNNNDINSILTTNNINYVKNLYRSIPKYLTNYETKSIDKLFAEEGKGNYSVQKDKKKNENPYISYNNIINNNQALSFLCNDDTMFDLNFYSSILHIQKEEYNLALEYISEDKKMINSKIQSLLGESYNRGYELLIKNQLLVILEQIIDYKSNHNNDNVYLNKIINSWDQSFNVIGKDPFTFEKILAIRSILLPIDIEFNNYMKFSKMCRKLDLFDQSMKNLDRIKKKMNITEI